MEVIQLREALAKLKPYATEESKKLADHILRAISVKDPKLALDLSLELPSDVKMLSVCYTIMAREHPEIVFKWLSDNRNSDSVQLMNACLGSFEELSRTSPEKSVAVLSVLSPKVKTFFVPLLMQSLALKDSKVAVDLAKKYLDGVDLDKAYVSILGNVSKTDPSQALVMLGDVSESAKAQCLKGMLPNLLQHEGFDPSILLSEVPAKDLNSIFAEGGVVERLVKVSPEKAISLIDSVPFTEQNLQLYSRLALSLAESNPGKAMDYLRTLPVGGASKEIAGTLFEKLARMDPEGAAGKISGLPPEYQLIATRGVARAIAKEDPEAAFRMAEKAEPSQRQDVYREVARQVTYSNPQDAVKLLENPKMTGILGSGFRSEMLDHTVRGWAKTDLAAARGWVEKLPATDLPKGVQGLMNPWMKADPVAASEWLATLPAGPARDAGARVIIEQVKNTDPEMADQWRKSMSQPPDGNK